MIKNIWVAHVLIVMYRHHKNMVNKAITIFYQKVSCITKFMEGDQHDAYISML